LVYSLTSVIMLSRALFVFAFAFLSLSFSVRASDVLILTPDNFDDHVGGDLPVFVEFFAPWCGHCKTLAPEYELAATAYKGLKAKVASVDADAHRDLGGRFGVTGFPTLKYFPAGSKEPETYSGGRTAADIVGFLNTKTGSKGKIKTAHSTVTILDPSNFDSIVLDKKNDVLVEFFAPWCGHCKKLAPDYEKVAQSYEGEKHVFIASVDADAHKELGTKYGVTGYPTIKFFPKDNKDGEDYNGGRTPEDFIEFINDRTGAERVLGGGYLPSAGLIPKFKNYIERFFASSSDEEKQLIVYEAENDPEHSDHESFKHYVTVFKKMIEGKKDYAITEIQRLTKILSGSSVKPTNKANFLKRINILKQFQQTVEA